MYTSYIIIRGLCVTSSLAFFGGEGGGSILNLMFVFFFLLSVGVGLFQVTLFYINPFIIFSYFVTCFLQLN